MGAKNFILDTNILLESPNAIYGFDDNNVIITSTTLQELDSKKKAKGELGYNARESCRIIEDLRIKGNLIKGVHLKNNGKFMVIPSETKNNLLPDGYSLDMNDNIIINTVLYFIHLQSPHLKNENILITNDVSMRINASICGIEVDTYHNAEIRVTSEYTGRLSYKVNTKEYDELFLYGKIPKTEEELIENEFVEIVDEKNNSTPFIYKNNTLNGITLKNIFNVTPFNIAQIFALYALSAPVEEIPIVILKGPAGSSKTFLSLAAGLDATYNEHKENKYDKLLITRNNSQIRGEEFGYLPGDIENKMMPLLNPFLDNMEALLRNGCINESNEQIQIQIDDMFASGIVDVCPIAYMRGRSIANSYLIVDECQNTTRSQMRDIITRIGKNTKLVLCGDPEQIDNHLLDKWNNGLTFASERMKGSPLCAQVTFKKEECVRSPLAIDALSRLTL